MPDPPISEDRHFTGSGLPPKRGSGGLPPKIRGGRSHRNSGPRWIPRGAPKNSPPKKTLISNPLTPGRGERAIFFSVPPKSGGSGGFTTGNRKICISEADSRVKTALEVYLKEARGAFFGPPGPIFGPPGGSRGAIFGPFLALFLPFLGHFLAPGDPFFPRFSSEFCSRCRFFSLRKPFPSLSSAAMFARGPHPAIGPIGALNPYFNSAYTCVIKLSAHFIAHLHCYTTRYSLLGVPSRC